VRVIASPPLILFADAVTIKSKHSAG